MRAGAGDVDTVLVGGEVVLKRRTADALRASTKWAARPPRCLSSQAYRAADAVMIERLRRHVEAYYQAWEVPDLTPWTVYNARG